VIAGDRVRRATAEAGQSSLFDTDHRIPGDGEG
jgi:hypothetical protein